MSKALPIMTAATALLLVAACSPNPTPAILEELTKKGIFNVQITTDPDNDEVFGFTGLRGADACKGTATVFGMGALTVDLDFTCGEPEEEQVAEPEEDPLGDLRDRCRAAPSPMGPRACAKLGDTLVQGPVALRDVDEGRKVYQRACSAGEPAGCVGLGWLYLKGLGGPQDVAKAESLFTKTCEGGYMDGCARLGRVHYVSMTFKTARELFIKACDGGSQLGCNGLGRMMLDAEGGDGNPAKAKTLFEAACRAEVMEACANLGGMYLKGQGVSRDLNEARKHLEPACDSGQLIACELMKQLPR